MRLVIEGWGTLLEEGAAHESEWGVISFIEGISSKWTRLFFIIYGGVDNNWVS